MDPYTTRKLTNTNRNTDVNFLLVDCELYRHISLSLRPSLNNDENIQSISTEGITVKNNELKKKSKGTMIYYLYRGNYQWNEHVCKSICKSVSNKLWPGEWPSLVYSSSSISFATQHKPSILSQNQPLTINLATLILSLSAFLFWFNFFWILHIK